MTCKTLTVEYIKDFTSEAVPKMIGAGMGVLLPAVEKALDRAVGNPAYLLHNSESTGSLFNSISVSNSFIRDNGTRFFANVYFKGEDDRKNPIRQGEKAAYLNYGTGSRKTTNGEYRGSTHKTDFAPKAAASSKKEVYTVMEAVLERELREENNNGK